MHRPASPSRCARRRFRALAALVAISALEPAPARAEATVAILPLDFEVTEFRGPASRVASIVATSDALRQDKGLQGRPLVVVWGPRGGAALTLEGEAIRTVPLGTATADLARLEAPRDALPRSRQQVSGPLSVFLSEPSREYPEGALGEPVEAKSLTIAERRPVQPGPDPKPVPVERGRVEAGPDAVFEDREPRLVSLDASRAPKILIVRSTRKKGAALAVVGRQDGAWRILAETDPAGERRWLNPAAAADFDADGQVDVAVVKAPHEDGVLQVWTWDGSRLVLKHAAAGFANHVRGSPALDLAAAVELEGGPPKLAVPTLDRRALAILSLRDGVREVQRFALPARAATGVAALGSGSAAHILIGLEDGRIADVRP